MALPPSLGAPQLTVSCWWPDPACTLGGASGGPTGVAVFSSDGGPSPTAFTAITRTVYSVPLVSPVMGWSSAEAPVVCSRDGSPPKLWLPDFHCTL